MPISTSPAATTLQPSSHNPLNFLHKPRFSVPTATPGVVPQNLSAEIANFRDKKYLDSGAMAKIEKLNGYRDDVVCNIYKESRPLRHALGVRRVGLPWKTEEPPLYGKLEQQQYCVTLAKFITSTFASNKKLRARQQRAIALLREYAGKAGNMFPADAMAMLLEPNSLNVMTNTTRATVLQMFTNLATNAGTPNAWPANEPGVKPMAEIILSALVSAFTSHASDIRAALDTALMSLGEDKRIHVLVYLLEAVCGDDDQGTHDYTKGDMLEYLRNVMRPFNKDVLAYFNTLAPARRTTAAAMHAVAQWMLEDRIERHHGIPLNASNMSQNDRETAVQVLRLALPVIASHPDGDKANALLNRLNQFLGEPVDNADHAVLGDALDAMDADLRFATIEHLLHAHRGDDGNALSPALLQSIAREIARMPAGELDQVQRRQKLTGLLLPILMRIDGTGKPWYDDARARLDRFVPPQEVAGIAAEHLKRLDGKNREQYMAAFDIVRKEMEKLKTRQAWLANATGDALQKKADLAALAAARGKLVMAITNEPFRYLVERNPRQSKMGETKCNAHNALIAALRVDVATWLVEHDGDGQYCAESRLKNLEKEIAAALRTQTNEWLAENEDKGAFELKWHEDRRFGGPDLPGTFAVRPVKCIVHNYSDNKKTKTRTKVWICETSSPALPTLILKFTLPSDLNRELAWGKMKMTAGFNPDSRLVRIFGGAKVPDPDGGAGIEGKSTYLDAIVTEHIEGETMNESAKEMFRLRKEYAAHHDEAIGSLQFALTEIAKGCVEISSFGYSHGDLKPHNIMVLRDGSIKIIDFGLTMPMGTTGNGEYGTRKFNPPEARGTVEMLPGIHFANVHASSDSYCIGAIAIEVLEQMVAAKWYPNEQITFAPNKALFFLDENGNPSRLPGKFLLTGAVVPAFIDFIAQSMTLDFNVRLTPAQLLSHPFLAAPLVSEDKARKVWARMIDQYRLRKNVENTESPLETIQRKDQLDVSGGRFTAPQQRKYLEKTTGTQVSFPKKIYDLLDTCDEKLKAFEEKQDDLGVLHLLAQLVDAQPTVLAHPTEYPLKKANDAIKACHERVTTRETDNPDVDDDLIDDMVDGAEKLYEAATALMSDQEFMTRHAFPAMKICLWALQICHRIYEEQAFDTPELIGKIEEASVQCQKVNEKAQQEAQKAKNDIVTRLGNGPQWLLADPSLENTVLEITARIRTFKVANVEKDTPGTLESFTLEPLAGNVDFRHIDGFDKLKKEHKDNFKLEQQEMTDLLRRCEQHDYADPDFIALKARVVKRLTVANQVLAALDGSSVEAMNAKEAKVLKPDVIDRSSLKGDNFKRSTAAIDAHLIKPGSSKSYQTTNGETRKILRIAGHNRTDEYLPTTLDPSHDERKDGWKVGPRKQAGDPA
jgi:serine/threonine protein kinase